jgi:hypothetical protein
MFKKNPRSGRNSYIAHLFWKFQKGGGASFPQAPFQNPRLEVCFTYLYRLHIIKKTKNNILKISK